MQTIPELLEARLRTALSDHPDATIIVGAATDRRFGDYQTNVAMPLAKARKQNPRQVAQEILARLDVSDMCETPEIAGAGFINFRLKPEFISSRFLALTADPRLGVPEPKQPKKIVFDFSSPNVAKPMHVGHIRSTILGDSLARIAEFIGHQTVRDNHIGDWGTQFGMLLVAWKTLMDRDALAADPIAELERIYKVYNGMCKADPAAEDAARAELVKLQGGDEENLGIWREMIRLSQVQFEAIYSRLGVRFDHALGESFYNPWLKQVVADLQAAGIARESGGALCVFSERSGPEKEDPFLIQRDGEWVDIPAMVQKADGASNYTTTDLATLEYRLREWAPDEIVYVTDGRQQLHFRQFFAIFRRWHPEAQVRLSHVWFGTILGDDGKPFRTRDGDTVKLASLLNEAEERAFALVTERDATKPENERKSEAERKEIARVVGIGAVKYADLLPNRQTDYTFSWDRMLSMDGNTAPYMLFAYARTRSIRRRLEESGVAVLDGQSTFTEPGELELVKKIFEFGELLPKVLDDYRPNLLCNYAYDLATAFHAFWEKCQVLKAEEPARSSRVLLCETTGRILGKVMELLGIEVLERM